MKKVLLFFTMLALSIVMVYAQPRMVTGKVTDSRGDAVPFASIKIKGSRSGVSADANGDFRIQAKTGDVLEITGISITPKEYAVTADTAPAAIQVDRSSSTIEGVVVTALGIRRTEKALGYAISKVDPASLLQKSEPDLLKSLQGKVAGVDIRSSQGTPGAAARIQIRGNNSFFGKSNPG